MRKSASIYLLILAAVLTSGCRDEQAAGPVVVGQSAPAYAAGDMLGEQHSLNGLRGRPVLLNVWATWCTPCRAEMPDLQELHTTFGPLGLTVVGVTIDSQGDGPLVNQFVQDVGATFDIWWDPDASILGIFGIHAIPTTYLIDRDGVIVWRHAGPVKSDDPHLLGLVETQLQ